MKIITKIFLLSILMLNQIYAQKDVKEMNIDGVKVIFKQAENDVVAFRMFIKGGTTNLTKENAGIENFALNVATTGGTENYPKEEYNRILEKLGSSISANCANDFSVISIRSIKDNFNKTYELFQDVILNPAFDSSEVELTREQLISSIKTEDTNPDALIRKEMILWFYQDHPYSNRWIGNLDNVNKFTRDELVNYYKNLIVKSRLLFVIVGKLDIKDVENKISNLLSKIPAGSYQEAELPVPARAKTGGYHIVEKPIPTNYIMGQYLLPRMNEKDYYAALLGHSILRDRVFEEVRTKRNLSYAPTAAVVTEKTSTGFIYVSTTDPDSAIKVMLAELDRLKKEPIPGKELNNHKMRFITMDFMRQETNAMQAGALAAAELYTGDWKNAQKLVDYINEVTSAQIQEMANKYIKNLSFVYVGKKKKVTEELFNYK
ncbi:MAG: Peptidase, M16 family [Ignavibacteriae bacterium]|nr:MAG: Peptidase, M16 family [Ignavibacteriota bacterium]